jgi:glyoxylase-like metal-dependent hydrolase (beta-lactamase superfamily II)
VQIFSSALWQTNAILVETGGTTVLVDSPVLPAELERLPRPDVLVVTHAHFDHVLARSVFPDLPLLAGPSTLEVIARGDWQGELRDSDEELYVERPAWPSLEGAELIGCDLFGVVDAPGHAEDGIALFTDDLLLCGDYLIEVEIPLVSQAGSVDAYLDTLDRLEAVVSRVTTVVPGHGPALDRARALELIELDRRYVSDLRAGPARGPDTQRQRRIHADNVKKHCA